MIGMSDLTNVGGGSCLGRKRTPGRMCRDLWGWGQQSSREELKGPCEGSGGVRGNKVKDKAGKEIRGLRMWSLLISLRSLDFSKV